jgi:hypothetical protein
VGSGSGSRDVGEDSFIAGAGSDTAAGVADGSARAGFDSSDAGAISEPEGLVAGSASLCVVLGSAGPGAVGASGGVTVSVSGEGAGASAATAWLICESAALAPCDSVSEPAAGAAAAIAVGVAGSFGRIVLYPETLGRLLIATRIEGSGSVSTGGSSFPSLEIGALV